jgi:ESS family glutamate:Na+ symporter
LPEPVAAAPGTRTREAYLLLKTVVIILAAMWAGSWLSRLFVLTGFTLPAYIGAMFTAALFRTSTT